MKYNMQRGNSDRVGNIEIYSSKSRLSQSRSKSKGRRNNEDSIDILDQQVSFAPPRGYKD
jgi:hypothetical protein